VGIALVAEGLPLTLRAYRLLTAAATPLAPALISHRLRHGKELPARLNERYGESEISRPSGRWCGSTARASASCSRSFR